MEDQDQGVNVGETEPPFKLYSLNAVALSAFIGGLLSGTVLLAANFNKLGDSDSSRNVIILGLAAFGLFVFALFRVPALAMLPDWGFHLLWVAVASWYGKWKQGEALLHHEQAGRMFYSKWRAIGIGLITVPLSLGVFVLVGDFTSPKLTFGLDHEVYYVKGASENEARKLGEYLESGYFHEGHGATVQVARSAKGLVVCFAVQAGKWDDDEVVNGFHMIRDSLAEQVFADEYVEVHLCDSLLKSKRVITPSTYTQTRV